MLLINQSLPHSLSRFLSISLLSFILILIFLNIILFIIFHFSFKSLIPLIVIDWLEFEYT